MSLKDLFTKQGRRERALQKNCAKASNRKIKTEDRRPALYSLYDEAAAVDRLREELAQQPDAAEARAVLEEATRRADEAISGLLRRFTFNYDTNSVVDEEEKNLVYECLVQLGERVLPRLRQHLKSSPTLSWGLRILQEICDHETTWEVISDVLADYDAGYERDPSRKLQLMTFLGDFPDQRAVDALLPFLHDHDETVRFVTAESLFKQGDDKTREPLIELMLSEEEGSLRIKHRIAEGLSQTGWPVKGFRGSVEKLLASHMPELIVDGKGRIKNKRARADT